MTLLSRLAWQGIALLADSIWHHLKFGANFLLNKERFEPMTLLSRLAWQGIALLADSIWHHLKFGATYRVRTDDLYLGKVSLYQLS